MIRSFYLLGLLAVMAIASAGADEVYAFVGEGCSGDCKACHSLSNEEASTLLQTRRFQAEVKAIRISPVGGLWEVELMRGNQRIIVYVDFAKKHMVEGRFTRLADIGQPKTLRKLDTSLIPLDDALVMGDENAEKRLIVFDDPDCPYCKKLHAELKKIVERRKDIVVFIKLYPLSIHPEAYEKAKAILCGGKSLDLLEDAFAGKELPEADCEAAAIDDNIQLVKKLGIGGTPTVIFPDGRFLSGYVDADKLLELMESPQ
ncbi:MAG: DsbC family protein [Thermodesulfobacteriota bacterium]